MAFDHAFYYPDQRTYWQPADFGLTHENVHFTADDGTRLHGWWLPARGDARGVVVHFHGNAANITNHIALTAWLPTAGYHLFMFDYRGYGRSEGRVTRAGTVQDGHAAVAWAATRAQALGLPLYAYGQSLGGAVAVVVVAERTEVAALVAESTFSGYRRIAARHGQRLLPFGPLARGIAQATVSAGFDPIDYVSKIAPRPLLVVAAEFDTVCFPDLARELFDAAGEPKSWWLVPNAGHLAILDGHERELISRITAFFSRSKR